MSKSQRSRTSTQFQTAGVKGLRVIIVSNMAAVMLTAIILTFLIVFRITSINLTRVEVRRAEDTMRSLQVSVSRFFVEQKRTSLDSRVELKKILSELVGKLDLMAVVVVDDNGKVIMRLPPKGPITLGGGEPDLRRAMGGREMVTTERRRGFGFFSSGIKELSVSVPIIARGEIKGGIKARFSMRRLDRNIKITQEILIGFIVATTFFMVFFGVFLLSRTVIRPIDELIDATRAFASGNMDKRVEIRGKNEISELAAAFNEMAEQEQQNRRRLEDNLEAIRQVNQDLERTRMELLYSEKLATVGRLAQGIAHEIGNPLSAVLGYLELITKGPELPEKTRDYVERSEREIARINVIIRELLDYSRPSVPDRKQIDVDEVVSALLTLVTGQKRFAKVTLKRNVDTGLPPIMADRNQLLQVLVNLGFNAADAMPEGGTLEVGASCKNWEVPSDEKLYMAGDISRHFEQDDKIVQIWIKDSGMGIAQEDITQVFDPFFTTKEPGHGTGLGLAICARIIEGFGAKISIESKEEKGTTFTIYFPVGA